MRSRGQETLRPKKPEKGKGDLLTFKNGSITFHSNRGFKIGFKRSLMVVLHELYTHAKTKGGISQMSLILSRFFRNQLHKYE